MRSAKGATPKKQDALEEDAQVQHSARRTPSQPRSTSSLLPSPHATSHTSRWWLQTQPLPTTTAHGLRRPPTIYDTHDLLARYTPLTTWQQRAIHQQQL